MAETPDLPPTLYDKTPSAQEKLMAEDEAQKLDREGASSRDIVAEEPQAANDQVQEGNGSSSEKPYTTIKVGVGIDLVELRLFVGGTRDASLATVQVRLQREIEVIKKEVNHA